MANHLMLGLWRCIIHVPPFLWKKQIAKGRKKIQTVYAGLSSETRQIHHFCVRELPVQGVPLSSDFISESLGLAPDLVDASLDELEQKMTFLFRNPQKQVTWAYPVTVDRTPHRIFFDSGEQLYAA